MAIGSRIWNWLVQNCRNKSEKQPRCRTINDPIIVDCSVVFRMTRDFASDVLPISGNRFAPTDRALSTQQNSWLFLLRSLERVFTVCVQGRGLPGWLMDTQNIVVAIWPRTSVMNELYGIRVLSAQVGMNASWLLLDSG